MYKLRIYLDSDGDFAHDCDTVNDNRSEVNIYYKSRALAIIKLRMFYSVLCKSIRNYDMMYFERIEMIKEFKEYLELIKDKFKTFDIYFSLGNPKFEIELVEVNPKTITGGGTILEEIEPNLTLSIHPSFKRDFNWESVKKLSPIEEGESNDETV